MSELPKNHECHSFTSENDREYSAIVLGLYDMDTETIKTGITDAGIAGIRAVYRKKTKSEVVLYVARFARGSTSIKDLREKCGKLCHCVVNWQPFSPAVKDFTQCRNCQQFGHAATNCRRHHRCIKCLAQHEKGECPRITREGTAKCVNCKGDHAANYKGCSTYQQFKLARLSQQRNATPNVMYKPAPLPTISAWGNQRQQVGASVTPYNVAFPLLPERRINAPPKATQAAPQPTPSNPVVQEKLNPFAKLQNLQQELLSISNIWEIIDEYKKLIAVIKSSSSPKQAAMALLTASFTN